jgi:hypothetical protein
VCQYRHFCCPSEKWDHLVQDQTWLLQHKKFCSHLHYHFHFSTVLWQVNLSEQASILHCGCMVANTLCTLRMLSSDVGMMWHKLISIVCELHVFSWLAWRWFRLCKKQQACLFHCKPSHRQCHLWGISKHFKLILNALFRNQNLFKIRVLEPQAFLSCQVLPYPVNCCLNFSGR